MSDTDLKQKLSGLHVVLKKQLLLLSRQQIKQEFSAITGKAVDEVASLGSHAGHHRMAGVTVMKVRPHKIITNVLSVIHTTANSNAVPPNQDLFHVLRT